MTDNVGVLLERMLGADLHEATTLARICGVARQVVEKPETEFGYSDVGDVLVSFLQRECTEEQAITAIRDLGAYYDAHRRPG